MKTFGLIAQGIGTQTYVAIKATNSELIAAYDPNDSVGIIDSYFPNASFSQSLNALTVLWINLEGKGGY